MKLFEVSEHAVMWMANKLLNKGLAVLVDIDIQIKDEDGNPLVLTPPRMHGGGASKVMGQLVGIEKRGQAFDSDTVVLHLVDRSHGQDECGTISLNGPLTISPSKARVTTC